MKNIFFIILLFSVSACGYFKPKSPKIRLVGLDGKPREVNTRTPNLNSEILNSQGKSNNDMILKDKAMTAPTAIAVNKNQPLKEVLPEGKAIVDATKTAPESKPGAAPENKTVAVNKPVELLKETDIKDPDAILFSAPKESEEYDISDSKAEKPAAKKPAAAKNNKRIKKPIFISKNKVQETVITESSTSEASSSEVGSGYFIQVGSFASEAHAQNKLDKMANFHSGKIEAAGDDKPIYRALLGPFSNKNSARNLLKKVKAAGQDAVLIKR